MSNFEVSRQKELTEQRMRAGSTCSRLEYITLTPCQEPLQEAKEIPPITASRELAPETFNEFLEDVLLPLLTTLIEIAAHVVSVSATLSKTFY